MAAETIETETRTQREVIYDEKIAPLMEEIIAVCKANDIPVLASFQLDDVRTPDTNDAFKCTTRILPQDAATHMHEAGRILVGPRTAPSPLMLTVKDGDGNVVSMAAVLP